jgi:hypothetical protein
MATTAMLRDYGTRISRHMALDKHHHAPSGLSDTLDWNMLEKTGRSRHRQVRSLLCVSLFLELAALADILVRNWRWPEKMWFS